MPHHPPRLGKKQLAIAFAVLLSAGMAMAQQLDTSELPTPEFRPLVDTAGVTTQAPVNASSQKITLTGKVQTLQDAIASETDVNWYAWYLACRAYLSQSGGLHCSIGTEIKFFRNGRMMPLTSDPVCLASATGRRFPLPQQTQLDALILPVRNGKAPPVSRDELYDRIQSNSNTRF